MVSIFGFPVEAIPLLTVITDIPNTVLNTTGNTLSSMLVARLVEGKNWLKDEVTNLKKVG